MTPSAPVAMLLDVDNTLLDNDRIISDLERHLAQGFEADTQASGAERADRYWAIFEKRRAEFGYADYLGALQRYRARNPRHPNFLQISARSFVKSWNELLECIASKTPSEPLSDEGAKP